MQISYLAGYSCFSRNMFVNFSDASSINRRISPSEIRLKPGWVGIGDGLPGCRYLPKTLPKSTRCERVCLVTTAVGEHHPRDLLTRVHGKDSPPGQLRWLSGVNLGWKKLRSHFNKRVVET
jgi:hypothetical protein